MHSIGTIVKSILRLGGIQAYSWKNMPWGISVERDLQRIHSGTRSPVLLDVGANVGQTALRFHQALPTAKIWCFEPIPDTFKTLRENTRHIPDIICVESAVGSNDGQVWMTTGALSEENKIVVDTKAGTDGQTQVKVISIDSFLAATKISRVDLLKTDCEGFDLDALKGASSSLDSGMIESVLCEVTLNQKSFHSKFHELDKFLRSKGFYFFAFYDYGGWGRFHSEGQFHNALWLRRP
jgi:FkbM family methyltransferase